MSSFHGDDIDRMLEGQSSAYFGGEGAGPPPPRRQRSRERDRRPRRSRSRERDRSRRRERDRMYERSERLDRERERDQRTVFAAQIHPKNEEREIFEFFSEVGKVVDIQLIRDTRTYKSKGLAYVEFEDRRSVPHALALSGRNLNGYPVLVQMTQSDRGYAVPQSTVTAGPTPGGGSSGSAPGNSTSLPQDKPKTLHITNLHKKLTEDDVTPIFSAFGEVRDLEMIDLPGEANEAFITFRRGAEATTAMVQLNGLEVVGKQISVEQAGEDSQMRAGQPANEEARDARFEDESGNGGVVMSLQDKRSLIQNLARSRGIAVPDSNMTYMNPSMKAEPAAPPPTGPVPTPCLLLKNMFNPVTETDPDFDLEIREDVREEVSSHGRLLHIYVDKNSRDGRVYLKFDRADASQKAHDGLDGRWFAQNRIEATYMDPRDYGTQFPGV